MGEECFRFGRTDPLHLFQRRGPHGFPLGRTHAGDGKAVHLLLQFVKKLKHRGIACHVDLFIFTYQRTGFVVFVLYHTKYRNRDTGFAQCRANH